MSLRKSLGVVAFGSAVALALYGVGCGGGGSGTGGSAGSGSGGASGSSSGGSKGSGSGGTSGTGTGGTKGTGTGGTKGSGFPDSGGGDSGPMCMAGSLTGFTGALNASAKSAGTCTIAQIKNIVDDCFGGNPDAGATACMDLIADAATKKCLNGCIQTPWTADASGDTFSTTPWGAIWYMLWGSGATAGIWSNLNVGGCYLAAAPTNPAATKCATDLQENTECYMTACAKNCPQPCNPANTGCTATMAEYMTAQNELIACFNSVSPSSGSGPCSTYSNAANTDCASLGTADSGALGQCNDAINILYGTGATQPQITAALTEFFDVVCGPSGGGGG